MKRTISSQNCTTNRLKIVDYVQKIKKKIYLIDREGLDCGPRKNIKIIIKNY